MGKKSRLSKVDGIPSTVTTGLSIVLSKYYEEKSE